MHTPELNRHGEVLNDTMSLADTGTSVLLVSTTEHAAISNLKHLKNSGSIESKIQLYESS